MAKRTNLIPSSEGKIQDVYEYFLEELKVFMKEELGNANSSLYDVICTSFTRDVVKSIFMPKIYGKTLLSTAQDLEKVISSKNVARKDYTLIANCCFKFWRQRFSGMECLIRLIRNIGWIASALGLPVIYNVPYFTTVQDYVTMNPINLWVYDKHHRKRRKVTLRIPSSKRDRRKTDTSTFVNFIHQKDAYIAMKVVEKLLEKNIPIYTVHDNFISIAGACKYIPNYYINVIRDMGPPLSIINEFIYKNVVKNASKLILGEDQGDFDIYCKEMVFPLKDLRIALEALIPPNLNKQKRDTWAERINGILNSYETYTNIVCGTTHVDEEGNQVQKYEDHVKRWNTFSSQFPNKKSQFNYSVHF